MAMMDVIRSCFIRRNLISSFVNTNFIRPLNTSATLLSNKDRARDRRDLLRGVPVRDDGSKGAEDVHLEAQRLEYSFPDEDTPNQLFDGIPYSNLPICHIKSTKNNTLLTLVDTKGTILIQDSCSRAGFKNCRKGTTVAAQVTGESMASKLLKAGIKIVRVCIRGYGPGRVAAVKAMAASGVTVASVTDTSPYDEYGPRPPAARSL